MPANVVLVHDDPQFLNEVAAALRGAGLTVAPFSEPMDGLDALKSANVAQILITRIRFSPGKPHGIALALMARRKIPGIKVLFVATTDHKEFAGDLGEFLAMPVSPELVLASVRRILGLAE